MPVEKGPFSNMTIRAFSGNDYPAILDIYAKSKLDELYFEEREFELLPLEQDETRLFKLKTSEIYVYEADGVIGFCAFYDAEIRDLFVHPKARGRGVGKRLLEFVLSKIVGPASLYVAKTNIRAKGLYGSYGFKVTDEFETSYNGMPVIANKMVQAERGGRDAKLYEMQSFDK